MNPSRMINDIDAAIAGEERTHHLRGILAQVARTRGREATGQQLDEAMGFVIDYVRHVPLLLIAMHGVAVQRGDESTITPLLDACSGYWEQGFDVIPDHLGLLGYTDDAYFCLSIVHAICERYKQAAGTPLMDLDLAAPNKAMRDLIGEPHATILDVAVASALAAPNLLTILKGLARATFPLVERDPIWGNASTTEIVNAQMGALGIV